MLSPSRKKKQVEVQARLDFQRRLGTFLKERRIASRLSQTKVSNRLKLKSSQYISNIERGQCAVPGYVLKEMVVLYEIDRFEFLNMLSKLQRDFYTSTVFSEPTPANRPERRTS